MKKIIIGASILVFTFLFVVLYKVNVLSPAPEKKDSNTAYGSEYKQNSNGEKNQEEVKNGEENITASMSIPHVTKYILKYRDNKVILICEYDNGKKTESEISGINVEYLTAVDKKYLTDGIELKSTEEVYKLIEDYSS